MSEWEISKIWWAEWTFCEIEPRLDVVGMGFDAKDPLAKVELHRN
jgi:hypothetical protein